MSAPRLAMVAARAAGMDTALGGTLGTGPFADMTTKALAELAIPHIGGTRREYDQGLCSVMLEPDGERTFVSAHGAEGHVTPEDLARIELEPDDWVMVSGYTLYYPDAAKAVSDWLAALPAGITPYLFAQRYGACQSTVVSAVFLSTLLSVATLSALLFVLRP